MRDQNVVLATPPCVDHEGIEFFWTLKTIMKTHQVIREEKKPLRTSSMRAALSEVRVWIQQKPLFLIARRPESGGQEFLGRTTVLV